MSFVAGLQYTATKFQLLQALTMPKQEKLLARLLKIPPLKDLTWNKLEPCLVALEFVFRPSAGSGSHGRFISEKDSTLFFCTCRPHPRPIVSDRTLKNIVAWLQINKII